MKARGSGAREAQGSIPSAPRAIGLLCSWAAHCHTLTQETERSTKKVSYVPIKLLKDGVLVQTKYEVAPKILDSPHLFVFANWEPADQAGRLTADAIFAGRPLAWISWVS